MNKKQRMQIIILVCLSSVLLAYTVYIFYTAKRIKDIHKQNLLVMDQMRMLYELEKNVEFNVDSNAGVNSDFNASSYCFKETPHFKIYSHNSELCEDIALSIENVYDRILEDLRYNISPSKKIGIYIFRDEQEYRSKIRQPNWSVGRTIYTKNSFYSYEGANLGSLIPHEITHLCLYDYMNRKYEPYSMRWLQEGLAVYEEGKISQSLLVKNLEKRMPQIKKGRFFKFEEVIAAEMLKDKNPNLINLWYAEAYSMVSFMINELGRDKFNQFCLNLKNNEDVQAALKETYKFKNLQDFQDKWLQYVRKKY